tara:strand:+ start:243 stop:866 length:624 start_codon:yes stop_codon:yes gene_type:complete
MGTFLIIVIIILAILVSLNGTGKLENIKAQLSNYQKTRVKNSNTGYLRIFDFADYFNTDPIPRSVFIFRIILYSISFYFLFILEDINNDLPIILDGIAVVFLLFIFYLWVINFIKRSKDIGWQPWLIIVPIVNVVLLLALFLSESKKGEKVYRVGGVINGLDEAVYIAPVSTDRKKELEDQIKQQEEEIEIEELEKKLEELKKKRKK